ncbi:hypothetical protein H2198_005148 [Neophaeococcomyces mojaviensis]|uniref:Uncharacterized protein n=1 Tax=Neophaeococcomyces mojaviensis TaxID=3383035 RepID=A0ACC3A727_9EURO|nr:hypothetical protein H2198_005148 [Knufia sp. JES_112]
MPEIAEIARAVHFIRKHLVGRKIQKVTAVEDANVFGKVGTSHTEIMKHLTGKTVIEAGQQGKYFWIIMSSPPHPVIHFGMSGWLKFDCEHTYYYKKKDDEDEEWPPKYMKFMVETDGKGEEKIEAAYVDARRLGRVRLVHCLGKDIRKHTPLVENGPDPVQDKDKVTVQWLKELCQRKKVPIKAMLLDQANISGIGNWVGDEIMYNAKMHPEQYANTLSEEQIEQLHKSIHYVCGTAVELLADSEQYPESWLFHYRWNKGKKDSPKALPSGEKIVFLTVGGRTSAVVPSVQKKTGPVAKEMSEAEDEEKPKKGDSARIVKAKSKKNEHILPAKGRGKKRVKDEDVEEDEVVEPASKRRIKTQPVDATMSKIKDEAASTDEHAETSSGSARKSDKGTKGTSMNGIAEKQIKPEQQMAKGSKKKPNDNELQKEEAAGTGQRRSARVKK